MHAIRFDWKRLPVFAQELQKFPRPTTVTHTTYI